MYFFIMKSVRFPEETKVNILIYQALFLAKFDMKNDKTSLFTQFKPTTFIMIPFYEYT